MTTPGNFIRIETTEAATMFVRAERISYLEGFDLIGSFYVVMDGRRLTVSRESFRKIRQALGIEQL